MSSDLRLKKLRGSGGYVMATVSDEQQVKGNLGGPDLFLAPIGRLDTGKITKHFCNTCEKEFEGPPKLDFENPNEEVAENLVLAERGQYICSSCSSVIAEYREFRKQDEAEEIGSARPEPPARAAAEQTVREAEPAVQTVKETATQPGPEASVDSIEGRSVVDENANKIGVARQVGIDSAQSMVLVITKNDGTKGNIPWSNIKKIGEMILLGSADQPGKCPSCGFANKKGSRFCEECGTKI